MDGQLDKWTDKLICLFNIEPTRYVNMNENCELSQDGQWTNLSLYRFPFTVDDSIRCYYAVWSWISFYDFKLNRSHTSPHQEHVTWNNNK